MTQIQLTKHEGEQFDAQTVYASGHAYIKCKLERCTIIIRNAPTHFEDCAFANCNWHFDYDVLWGDPNTRSTLRQLLDLIDGAADMHGS